MKLVILGNSGSGKTWLATKIALARATPIIHFDELYWAPGGFSKKREASEISGLIGSSLQAPEWIAEGVFGDLAEAYLGDADTLIWLDIDWPTCQRRLEKRGTESKTHMNRPQSVADFDKLIKWAADYSLRTDKRSFQGHQTIFERFPRARYRLRSDADVQQHLLKRT